MQKLIKKIASFSDDIYRDLPYGTIYYIASEQNIALNNYVKENADDIIAKLNRESSIWISFKLVCLDSKNDYIYSYGNAALYSALIPYKTEPQQNYNFFAAYAEPFSPRYFWEALFVYARHLQDLLDEALEGSIDEDGHITKSDSIFLEDERPEFSFGSPLFSITDKTTLAEYTEPSRLVITNNTYQFLLPDYDREIKFNAQIKALYVLFLLHVEGIRLQELDEHRQEFTRLYMLFTNRSDKERLLESINRLLDIAKPEALYVKKSQCYKALRQAIPNKDLLQYYEIKVHRGEAHSISLDRSLVTYPEKVSQLN